MRGARRGCVRLRGAVIGIDDEDDSTFTITTSSSKDDAKTFHFQTRNGEERERWVRALEDTILRHAHAVDKKLFKERQIYSLNIIFLTSIKNRIILYSFHLLISTI